ncbi:MAG: hypothetical protein ACR652_10615 [Methylocystis sp.]|uniref:hypothetical protein n=1 Tax=Methylocystis sp. TaxID=1911079 RepID=UPI003DA363BD
MSEFLCAGNPEVKSGLPDITVERIEAAIDRVNALLREAVEKENRSANSHITAQLTTASTGKAKTPRDRGSVSNNNNPEKTDALGEKKEKRAISQPSNEITITTTRSSKNEAGSKLRTSDKSVPTSEKMTKQKGELKKSKKHRKDQAEEKTENLLKAGARKSATLTTPINNAESSAEMAPLPKTARDPFISIPDDNETPVKKPYQKDNRDLSEAESGSSDDSIAPSKKKQKRGDFD